MDREVRRELEGRFEGVVMTSACGSDGCGVGQRALGGRIEASPQRAAAHRPHRASVRHRRLQNVRPQPLYRSPPSIHRLLESVGSSSARFENAFSSAGINQTKHQIILNIDVTVSILLPGFTTATKISNAVTVAETIIVGTVPDTYTYFSTSPETYEEDLKDYILNNG